jgi:hypothetical protein
MHPAFRPSFPGRVLRPDVAQSAAVTGAQPVAAASAAKAGSAIGASSSITFIWIIS